MTYAYEVNTSIFIYWICDRCRMCKRSIRRLRITFTLIFGCFVCIEAMCLDYVSRLYPLLPMLCYNFFKYTHMWSRVYVFDRIHMINIYICMLVMMYVILLDRMWSFLGKGSWWLSSDFCENGVVTIPFQLIFVVVIPVGHLDFVIYNNKTHIATMML